MARFTRATGKPTYLSPLANGSLWWLGTLFFRIGNGRSTTESCRFRAESLRAPHRTPGALGRLFIQNVSSAILLRGESGASHTDDSKRDHGGHRFLPARDPDVHDIRDGDFYSSAFAGREVSHQQFAGRAPDSGVRQLSLPFCSRAGVPPGIAHSDHAGRHE